MADQVQGSSQSERLKNVIISDKERSTAAAVVNSIAASVLYVFVSSLVMLGIAFMPLAKIVSPDDVIKGMKLAKTLKICTAALYMVVATLSAVGYIAFSNVNAARRNRRLKEALLDMQQLNEAGQVRSRRRRVKSEGAGYELRKLPVRRRLSFNHDTLKPEDTLGVSDLMVDSEQILRFAQQCQDNLKQVINYILGEFTAMHENLEGTKYSDEVGNRFRSVVNMANKIVGDLDKFKFLWPKFIAYRNIEIDDKKNSEEEIGEDLQKRIQEGEKELQEERESTKKQKSNGGVNSIDKGMHRRQHSIAVAEKIQKNSGSDIFATWEDESDDGDSIGMRKSSLGSSSTILSDSTTEGSSESTEESESFEGVEEVGIGPEPQTPVSNDDHQKDLQTTSKKSIATDASPSPAGVSQVLSNLTPPNEQVMFSVDTPSSIGKGREEKEESTSHLQSLDQPDEIQQDDLLKTPTTKTEMSSDVSSQYTPVQRVTPGLTESEKKELDGLTTDISTPAGTEE